MHGFEPCAGDSFCSVRCNEFIWDGAAQDWENLERHFQWRTVDAENMDLRNILAYIQEAALEDPPMLIPQKYRSPIYQLLNNSVLLFHLSVEFEATRGKYRIARLGPLSSEEIEFKNGWIKDNLLTFTVLL